MFNPRIAKTLLTFSALLLIVPHILFAQVATEDVVYLKNGSIIRGKVIEFVPNGNIKIEILGGSILVYPAAEVEKILNEPMKVQPQLPSNPYVYTPKPKAPFVYKNSGITNLVELGFLAGGNGAGVFFSNSINYILHPRLQIGAGGGFERYDFDLRFFPAYLDVRGDIIPNAPVTPYYFGHIGFGFPVRPSNDWNPITDLQGGLNAGLGLGVKFNTRSALRWTASLAYKLQSAHYSQTNWSGWPQEVNATFYRISVRLGFAF